MAGIPPLSHLQFLVVGILRKKGTSGREIRSELGTFGVRKSGPAFYQLMSRLEDSGFVVGEYSQEVVDGQIFRERHYRIASDGSRAWERSRDFYVRAIADLGRDDGLASV